MILDMLIKYEILSSNPAKRAISTAPENNKILCQRFFTSNRGVMMLQTISASIYHKIQYGVVN